jgi:hypothetical protein
VTTRLYLEGGGDSKESHSRCREGFRKLLEDSGFRGRMPRLVACGGRDAVYDDFVTEHMRGDGAYVAMWIDAEEPMADTEDAWRHLRHVKTVSQWARPKGASDNQVLFMTTCMETWIIADRSTLRKHYGNRLQESGLPPTEDLEQRARDEVQEKLVHATRNCSNAYAKGKRSFEILGKLAPTALEKHLPSFVRARRILEEKL